ncbi:Nitrogen permease regulator 2-like [Pseudocercospora fuligena]|uniref:Nitrogen permease regulator 2-like n=1 Tax=Pseudocercospora fuligena TaxID=685502 RepID=A0A8H6RD25_9PEZI|nr:Nitrogen permease regulator 2-like [Pseudocercospora fuligena]
MLKAVFYARFHPERGPSVIHQYPNNTIRAAPGHEPLLPWSDISSYIIPPYDLCNQPLSICTNGYRIIAYPVSLEHDDYHRNRFTFNVCFVLTEDEDAHPWQQVARKTARFFTEIEWDDCMLQKEEDSVGLVWAGEEGYPRRDGGTDVGNVYGLLESIVEDLNKYGETCVRIDAVHILNLRLEYPKEYAKDAPDRIRAWDVPLLVRSVPSPGEWTWDLTLVRIHDFIDGIKHVQKIAELADVELKLVKRAVKELVHHGKAILLDIFHFQAIYACTDEMVYLLQDPELRNECRRYVAVLPTTKGTNASVASSSVNGAAQDDLPAREDIVSLYSSLSPGLNLSDFCLTNKDELACIDIRRFITFGIIKGFLRRIHKYALAMEHRPASPVSTRSNKQSSGSNSRKRLPRSGDDAVRDFERAWRKAALTSGWATPPSGPHPASLGKSHKSADRVRSEEDEKLRSFLDGQHCMDQICVEMRMSEKKVLERLRSGRLGEVILFNK